MFAVLSVLVLVLESGEGFVVPKGLMNVARQFTARECVLKRSVP
jgi:hypothetical protein